MKHLLIVIVIGVFLAACSHAPIKQSPPEPLDLSGVGNWELLQMQPVNQHFARAIVRHPDKDIGVMCLMVRRDGMIMFYVYVRNGELCGFRFDGENYVYLPPKGTANEARILKMLIEFNKATPPGRAPAWYDGTAAEIEGLIWAG